MGRRMNNCQLPASPLIKTVELKRCSTGHHATRWKSSEGILISKGNPGQSAWTSFFWLAENMRKELGSKWAVSAEVTGMAASPPLGNPGKFLLSVLRILTARSNTCRYQQRP